MRRAIVLIFGLSGVGKSTVARTIVRKLGFRHVNLDEWDKEGEFDPELESAWGRFYQIWDPEKFHARMCAHLDEGSWPGAVVTFAAVWTPRVGQLEMLAELGITCVVLTGDAARIRQAAVRRERGRGRQGALQLWDETNLRVVEMLDDSDYDPYRVEVFAEGERRPPDDVVAEVMSRLR